ncbi:MAG: hypothetical protein RI900_1597 [Actinomycetota bacterium]
MNTMVTMTAGVRVVFATDSPVVELTCHPRTIHTVTEPLREPVFQMLVDGEPQPDAVARGGSFVHVDRLAGPAGLTIEEGGAVVLRWDDIGSHRKEIEIWFPTHSSVEVQSLKVAAGSTTEVVPVRRRRWTHYGSSISHCMDVDRPFDAWPAQVARRQHLELTNFALAGQCQLDPFMGRVIRDAPADVISLKLGINLVNANSMTERTFGPAVHGLLDHIRDGHADTPLLVASPIFCPLVEDHVGPTVPRRSGGFRVVDAPPEARPFGLTLQRIREVLASIVAARRAAGDEHLHHIDGLRLFGPDDEHLLHDRLHPSPEGYALLGQRFEALAFAPGAPLAAGGAS